MANELDEIFEALAKKAEAEAKASKSSNGYSQKTYEEIKYTGLETGVPLVVRAIGGYPDNPDSDPHPEYMARTVNICRIVGDDGKKFRLIKPRNEDDPNYIINRIISRVTQARWVNNEKTFPVKEQFPEVYNTIDKNGLPKGDPKLIYEKGWKGKEVLMMNVIDRAQMDWHKANKHTMLLAKSITESNGVEYVDEGVSSYAIKPKLTQLFKYYKSWENYDMAITKTGNMNDAFIVTNASKNPETVEGPCASFISTADHLTDEEKSWEKYDLNKLFKVTSYTKIYNRLKVTIARIDTALKTNFLTELETEVEKEKAEFEKLYPKDENGNTVETTPVKESVSTSTQSTTPSTPTRTRTSVASSKAEWEKLPYGSTLSNDLKSKVKSVTVTEDGKYDVEWDTPIDNLASCPTCGAVSPMDATQCPCCGMNF